MSRSSVTPRRYLVRDTIHDLYVHHSFCPLCRFDSFPIVHSFTVSVQLQPTVMPII